MPSLFPKTVTPSQGDFLSQEKALLLTKDELNEMLKRFKWKENEEAIIEADERGKQSLKSKALRLKKNWPNTCQAGGERQVAEWKARPALPVLLLPASLPSQADKIETMRNERDNERAQYLTACQRLMSYNKDDVKLLNQALIFAETVREREAQIEFRKKLQITKDEDEAKEILRIQKDVANFLLEEEKKKREQCSRQKEYQATILQQIKDCQDNITFERESNRRLEKADMNNAMRECDNGAQYERKLLEKRQKILKHNAFKSYQANLQAKIQKEFADKKSDKEIHVHASAKQRIAQLVKIKVDQAYDEKIRLRAKIMYQCGKETIGPRDFDNEASQNAIKKLNAEHRKIKLCKVFHDKKLAEERIKEHHKFLLDQEKLRENEEQMKKWLLIQRLKTEEVNDKFLKATKKTNRDEMLKRRLELKEQMEEKHFLKTRDLQAEAEILAFEKKCVAHEDKTFFKYASEVVEDSQRKGRILLPLERSVQHYKKRNNLTLKKALHPEFISSIVFA